MTPELTPGSVLGRYELLIQVAQGSIAQVWAARLRGAHGFQKIVAIKTLTTNKDSRALTQALLLDEVRLAALVHHPNVVGTLELGEARGVLFIVMEWVHGETLRAVVRASYQYGGLPRSLAVNIIAQACRALQAAHEARDPDGKPVPLLHRDISPQNLLVSYTGSVKVADFGIAKAHHWNAELSGRNEMRRKLAYMSPEQLLANGVDRRSDLFSVGVVLYLITTGQHPFKGNTPEETIHNVCFHPPTRPTVIARDYPQALEDIVLKALAKDPTERWPSASEMVDALLRAEPTTSDRNTEQRIAQFMANATGEMGKNRMQLVHHAQQWLDNQTAPNPTSSAPPPLPRRSRRDSAITLSSISVSGFAPIADHFPSSELVPRSDSNSLRYQPALESRPLESRPSSSSQPKNSPPSLRTSTLREAMPDSVHYSAPAVDASRRSDWGTLVPSRREAGSQTLAWLGGVGVVGLLVVLAVRETQRAGEQHSAKPEVAIAALRAPEPALECVGGPQLAPEPSVMNANDLPHAEPEMEIIDVPAAPRPNVTTRPQPELVAQKPPLTKRTSSTPTHGALDPAPSMPARQVDAWNPNDYGGRN